MNMSSEPRGALYSATVKCQLIRGKCNVEVATDLNTGQAKSVLTMPGLLSSQPLFDISLDDLKALASGAQQLKARARLKGSAGNATAVVFQPEGKPAQFTLHIGAYNQHGGLAALDMAETPVVIEKLTGCERLALVRAASASR